MVLPTVCWYDKQKQDVVCHRFNSICCPVYMFYSIVGPGAASQYSHFASISNDPVQEQFLKYGHLTLLCIEVIAI